MIQEFQSRGIEFSLSGGGELLFRGNLTDADRETIRRNKEYLIMELESVGRSKPTPEGVWLAGEIETDVADCLAGSDFLGWSPECRKAWARSIIGIIDDDGLTVKPFCLTISRRGGSDDDRTT